ncbi:MAG: NEW3 domain-containing protein, partial [Candidatus Nanohaloarchaea archaeon]|nr:NEW3 domain-containing protein [Candidatus Nanohaloarchaea archaeon]
EPGPVKINLRPVNETVKGPQGKLTPVSFTVENIGGSVASNITIEPEPGGGWEVRPARVDSLQPNETVNRTVFLRPSATTPPATYAVPTRAVSPENKSLDLTYFRFQVVPGNNLSRIRIAESPPEISLKSEGEISIPILVRNTGKKPLTGVKARLQNVGNCLRSQDSNTVELGTGEEKTVTLTVSTAQGPSQCLSTLIVSSDQDAYAISRMKLDVRPPAALLPAQLPLIPILTAILIAAVFLLIVFGGRGRRTRLSAYAAMAVLILLTAYLAASYFGYVPLI